MRMMLDHLTGSLRGRTQFIDTDFGSFGIGEPCGGSLSVTRRRWSSSAPRNESHQVLLAREHVAEGPGLFGLFGADRPIDPAT